MTPLQIAMYDKAHQSSDAVHRQRQDLITYELLETDESSRSGYRVTERGVAYVKALCEMPFPIKKWVMPDKAA